MVAEGPHTEARILERNRLSTSTNEQKRVNRMYVLQELLWRQPITLVASWYNTAVSEVSGANIAQAERAAPQLIGERLKRVTRQTTSLNRTHHSASSPATMAQLTFTSNS